MPREKHTRTNTRSERDMKMMPPRKRLPDDVSVIDVNDPDFLRRFMTEQGKIVAIRNSGLTAKQQRQLKRGVRRARNMGLVM